MVLLVNRTSWSLPQIRSGLHNKSIVLSDDGSELSISVEEEQLLLLDHLLNAMEELVARVNPNSGFHFPFQGWTVWKGNCG